MESLIEQGFLSTIDTSAGPARRRWPSSHTALASISDSDWLGDDDYDEMGNLIPAKLKRQGRGVLEIRARNPRIQRAWDRRRKVVEMKMKGYTFADIAPVLGYNTTEGVREAFTRAMQDTIDVAEEYRSIELMRMQSVVHVLWPMVEQGDLEAIDKYLKVSAQIQKLTKTDSLVPVGHQVGGRAEGDKANIERVPMVEDVNIFLQMLPALVALSPQPDGRVIDQDGKRVASP